MASPYFQRINVQQADFSPIVRGGEAMGAAFNQVGQALGKMGNAYFERQAMMKSAEDFIKTPAGENYLKTQAGWNDKQIAELREDPKQGRKLVYDAMKEGGGPEKFKEYLREIQREERMIQAHKQTMAMNRQSMEKNKILLDQVKEEEASRKRTKNLYPLLFKKDEETGNIQVSAENLISKVPEGSEREAYELLDSMGMNQMNVGGFINSLRESDGDIFTRPNVLKQTLARGLSLYPRMPLEDQKRASELVSEQIIDPQDITKSATEFWATDEMNKRRIDVLETSDSLMVNINTAIGQDSGGKYYIKNAPAAGTAMRGYARVANGVGVMTDQDVKGVGGPSNYNAWWNRFTNRFFGSVEREATQQDVDLGYADKVGEITTINAGAQITPEDLMMMQQSSEAIIELNNKKLQDAGVATQEHLQKTYSTVSNERLLELNPYAEYFNDAYRIDISNDQWPILQRIYQTEKREGLQKAIRNGQPRATDGQIQQIENRLLQMMEQEKSQANPQAQGQSQPMMQGINPDANATTPQQPALGVDANTTQPTSDNNSTSSVDPGRVDRKEQANAYAHSFGVVASGAGAGAAHNYMANKLYGVSDFTINKAGKIVDKVSGKNARLSASAERLLPEKIKSALRNNPAAMFEKHGGMGEVAKKYGIKDVDQLTPETLEKKIKLEVTKELREKLAQRGGQSFVKKLYNFFRPTSFAKKLMPYVGWSMAIADATDLGDTLLDAISTDRQVSQLQEIKKVHEEKLLKSGVNPLELIIVAEAFEALIKEAGTKQPMPETKQLLQSGIY